MNHYIEIKLNPDDDIPVYFLRNTCFKKLHKALFTLKKNDIGVSFPSYEEKVRSDKIERYLGDTIRLHGNKSALEALQQSNWLGGLAGYCEVGEILPVPENIEGYRTVSRKQPTMTLKKLEKRIQHQKASGVLNTEDEIKAYQRQYKEKMYASSLDNPYLELQSTSTGKLYRVFIQMGEIQDNPVSGEFNYFGLSKTATIPWFSF